MWASASARHAFGIDDTYVSNASFRRSVREPSTHESSFVELVFREMPRYFFHFKRGQVTLLDQEGVELADIEQAVKEAARRAQEIVSKDVQQRISANGRTMIIADEGWHTVVELPF
jgi:hypothetical protein